MEELARAEREDGVSASQPTRRAIGEFLLRYLAIVGVCFWMGGFTFYAGVVIHVGHRLLESPREIGFLTREVTVWLNRSGVIVLVILLVNHLYYARNDGALLRRCRLLTLLLMAGIQVALFRMHPMLDKVLDLSGHAILDRSAFHALHLRYMNLSTVQWAVALAHMATVLLGWQRSDRETASRFETQR